MSKPSIELRLMRWAAPLLGTTFLFGDCDPTLRTTAENGIITAVNSLFAAFLQALVQLGAEDSSTTAILLPLLGR